MVKIFFGNLPESQTVRNEDIRPLFENFGEVTECEVIKNYGFVHMSDEGNAEDAIKELNGYEIYGRKLRVERSDGRNSKKSSIKIFIGNVADGTTGDDLRNLFADQAEVIEADVMTGKNFGFVHLDSSVGRSKVGSIIRSLDGTELNGNRLRVQPSTSDSKTKPGMGGSACFKCGRGGHWSKECPMDGGMGYGRGGMMMRGGRGGPMRGRGNFGPRSAPYPPMGGGPRFSGGYKDFSDDVEFNRRPGGRGGRGGRGSGSGGGPMRDRFGGGGYGASSGYGNYGSGGY